MMDNVDMDWTVMDKMAEILKDFSYNSPISVSSELVKGEYTKKGKLIEPYRVTLNPETNLDAVIEYRDGKEFSIHLGRARFVPARIEKLIFDFLRAGCRDFNLNF